MISENTLQKDDVPRSSWPGRIGLVLETPALVGEISAALAEIGADCGFRVAPGVSAFEVASLAERGGVDLVFVELAKVPGPPAEWMAGVRAGSDRPLITAVHPDADPAAMIAALRAGAGEFLSLPVRPGIYEALDRMTMLLESRRAAAQTKGKMAGILSAKGGCGATTVACHLAAALRSAPDAGRVLVADLDTQSSDAHRVLRREPKRHLGHAFENVRRLNGLNWSEYVCGQSPELLAGAETGAAAAPPEPWRMESLFRFISRNYAWVLADLGRNLNPVTWGFIQNLDEIFIVTAPDVLALYQTRSILQTLSGRGFERARLHLILNRNLKGPQDFWIESIRKMFEMDVTAVIPDDPQTLGRIPPDHFEFPAATPFGRAITKLAARISKPAEKENGRKAN